MHLNNSLKSLLLCIFVALLASADIYRTDRLIPPPKGIDLREGNWALPDPMTAWSDEAAKSELDAALGMLRAQCAGKKVFARKASPAVYLEISDRGTPENPEGYVLEVSEKGVRISARDVRGVFYGIQTLGNMLMNANGEPLPCMVIRDWPGLEMRMINLHVPGLRKAVLPQLRRLISLSASLKYNTVLLCVTNAFPYDAFKVDPGTDLEKKDMTDLTEYCRKNHIEIIPYIQLLSHVNWLSKMPEWPDLLENPAQKNIWGCTWCPNHPSIRKIWESVLDEQIKAFKPRYFHIALDEILQGDVATCPRCRHLTPNQWLKEELDRYLKFLRDRNVTPIVWHDSFVHPKHTKRFYPYRVPLDGWKLIEGYLPKDTPIHFWDYGLELDTPAADYFTSQGFRLLGGAWLPAMGNIPLMAKCISGYGDKGMGAAVLSWYYFSNNPENGFYKYGYRTWPGFIIGGHALWAPDELDQNLDKLDYEPSFEARKRFFPELNARAVEWQQVPIGGNLNVELDNEEFAPRFSKAKLFELKADYAAARQHFRICANDQAGTLRAVAVSGSPNGGDGLPAGPIEVPTGKLQARQLAFLMAIVPTDRLELENNEWHNFNGYKCPAVGSLHIQRGDGSTEKIALRRAWNIFNWNAQFSGWTGSFVAWHHDNRNRLVQFSVVNWKNSKPEIPITSVKLESAKYMDRAVALLAISASDAKEVPAARPVPPTLAKCKNAIDWRTGKIEAMEQAQVAKRSLKQEGIPGVIKEEFIPYPGDENKTCVHLSIPPAKGVFGRVMYDIPISVPDYASAFAFDLKVSEPDAFRDGAFYIMDKQMNCLVDGKKPDKEEQFNVCVFRNMQVEGKRISPRQATDMRISFRISPDRPVEIWFTLPAWYQYAPSNIRWNITRGQ